MCKYLLLFLLILTSCVTQPDTIINNESLKEISILVFSSDESLHKLLTRCYDKNLRGILSTALIATTNNISNYYTTRTEIPNTPYKYQYIYINEVLEWKIMQKELFKYVYDPTHPDSIREGEMAGFVRYPDIKLYEEENNLMKILDILLFISK
jgi:starvation-inducible outer membrane lipoprotein